MAEIEKKWYVLRAISGRENKVKEYLESEIKNTDLGQYVSQVLIPTEKVYQVHNGKKVVKERSYLPGYVLVEVALYCWRNRRIRVKDSKTGEYVEENIKEQEINGDVYHRLRNVPDVLGFLSDKSDKPSPVRQSEINKILGSYEELQDSGDEVMSVPFYVGDSVKVAVGPFSGFSGVIEEVNNERKKLKVMVKIFGRKSPLELSFMQVEKE